MFLLRQRPRGRDDDRLDEDLDLCRRSGSLSWQSSYRRDTFLAASHGQAGQGERHHQILAFAYPDNSLSRGSATLNLPLLPKAKAGGEKNAAVAAYITRRDGVHERDVFEVCRLVSGFPYTDRQQKRVIFVTSLRFRIGWI
ncbi:DUF2300 domain-containing protein [Shigella boydii]